MLLVELSYVVVFNVLLDVFEVEAVCINNLFEPLPLEPAVGVDNEYCIAAIEFAAELINNTYNRIIRC